MESEMSATRKLILGLTFVLVLPLPERGDAEDANNPIPGSAYEIEGSMDREFEQKSAPETRVSRLLESSEVTLKLRNFYFNRGKPQAIDSYAWAQGGILAHRMGNIDGVFTMNTELMGSFPLDAPEEHTGTLLLDKHQNELLTLGVVNPRITAYGQVVSLYRQRYNLPYVNEQDNRMLPNTFEGYTIGQPTGTSKSFQYIAGYIAGMKKRDSDDFVSMSDAAGVNQVERGMVVSGARAYFIPEWSLAAVNYYMEDVVDIVYADTDYKFKINEEIEQTLSGQYSSQTSVGDDLLFGEVDSTGFWGFQSATSFRGFVFKAALTVNENSADIKTPYGSYPGYNSSIVEDFNRAGEYAWQLGMSFDLSEVGLDGFKVSTGYIQGNGALNQNTGADLPDRNEIDVTVDYRVSEGLFNGIWVRARSGTVDDEEAGTTQDFRVIVNYEIALYRPDLLPE